MATPAEDTLYIDGAWCASAAGELLSVVSPLTEQALATVQGAGVEDVQRAVLAARRAFDEGPWPRLTPSERADALERMAALLEARADTIAATLTAEVGSPRASVSAFQATAGPATLRYYAGLARETPLEEERQGAFKRFLVRREPVGVVGAIVPWNVPVFLSVMKLAPALAAGCTVVLKPAPETPLHAIELARCADEAGLPPGVVNVVPAGRQASERLVTHRAVDKISFTGSTATGGRVGALCGEAIRRCSLELGGKSPAILLDDVDLDASTPQLVRAAMMNNGQMCVAQTRILAPASRYTEVVDAVAAETASLPVGDPADAAIEVGPLVSSRQRARVEDYLALGRQEGARTATGGGRTGDAGWFVEPTVLDRVDNSMRVAREEIFGPVVAVIPYRDEDEAVAIANDSPYGLSASVWGDTERGLAIARRLRTGTVALGEYALDPLAPFGGFKQSGIGREWGPEGLDLYVELKSIHPPA